MKEIYNFIVNDKFIIDTYEKIRKFEDADVNGWTYHDFTHALNVSKITSQILDCLNYDEDLIYSAKIAAILHDTGALEGKDDHPLRGYIFAKEYFTKNNINFPYKDMVLEAIKIHSDGFDTDNIIALCLILADKIDVKYTRITKKGKKVIGNRQYANIMDIKVNMVNNIFMLNFITNDKINVLELNEYYFTKKIFKAVQAFCNKLNIKYQITMNDKPWVI